MTTQYVGTCRPTDAAETVLDPSTVVSLMAALSEVPNGEGATLALSINGERLYLRREPAPYICHYPAYEGTR